MIQLNVDFALNDVEELLNAAIHMLQEGIELFKNVRSIPNVVILQSNLGMCYRTLGQAIKMNLMQNFETVKGGPNIKRLTVPVTSEELKMHLKAIDEYSEAFRIAKDETDKKANIDLLLNAGFNISNCCHVTISELWTRNVNKSVRDFEKGTELKGEFCKF